MATHTFIGALARNLLRPDHPGQLVFFVTDRCNCRCDMCFNAANVFSTSHAPDMSLDNIRKMARSLRPLPQLLLSGGEPFMRADISEIVSAFYHDAGTRQFSIPTNGALSKRILAASEEILANHPNVVLNMNLSLDNVGAAHDNLRNLPGCYERVCETYARLDALRQDYKGLSVNISTIITEATVNEAERIVSDIRARFEPNYHAIGILRSNDTGTVSDALLLMLSEKITLDVLDKGSFNALPLLGHIVPAMGALIKKRYISSFREHKRCFTCLAGKKIIVVTADGRLMPCEPLWLEKEARRSDDENEYMMARLEDYDFDVSAALASKRAGAVKHFVTQEKCWCSYMCAIQNGILYSPRAYPLILLEMLRR